MAPGRVYLGSTALQTFSGGLTLTAASLNSTGPGSLLLGADVTTNASNGSSATVDVRTHRGHSHPNVPPVNNA